MTHLVAFLSPNLINIAAQRGGPICVGAVKCALHVYAAKSGPPPLKTQLPEPSPPSQPCGALGLRVAATVAFGAYVTDILSHLGGAPNAGSTLARAVTEAFQLSFNFGLVSPLVLPHLAPLLHPCLEGTFNAVLAWALLLIGFAAEDESGEQRVSFGYVALGVTLLTNVVYLPFIALRRANATRVKQTRNPSPLLRVAESRILPLACLALALAATAWSALARPEFGDWATRSVDFARICDTDPLARSLVLDEAVLAIFQSALVADDVRRRGWATTGCARAVAAARFVPFFGLCFYLWERARCSSLIAPQKDAP